ncbi:MAG: hypothetical protein H6574_10450 [Lewinellaceae bacterium]|nr:hypothetical protein [Saprospiraceae bacterium]MCB9331494.1 hypothetical protein [Lewinellaceae bacterium]
MGKISGQLPYLCHVSNTGHLLERYREHPAVVQLSQAIQQPHVRVHISGLTGAQGAFVLASTVSGSASTVLYIAESKEEAAYLLNDLQGILPTEMVLFFPDSFKRPAVFDVLNPTQTLQRSEVVNHLTGSGSVAIITYPEALFEKVVSPEVLAQSQIEIAIGEKLDVDFVIQVLVEYGFERTDFVYEPGQFSIRGGIVDLFSFGNELPYRIELFDDEVESIRTFDPLTQLSKQSISRVRIVPNLNTRFRQDQKVSLFRILPENAVIWIRDFQFLLDRLQYCFEKAEQYAGKITALDAAELRELFRDRAFVYPADVVDDVRDHTIVFLEKPGPAIEALLDVPAVP